MTVSVHDLNGNRISEHGPTGIVLREYIWLDGRPLAVIEGGQLYHLHWTMSCARRWRTCFPLGSQLALPDPCAPRRECAWDETLDFASASTFGNAAEVRPSRAARRTSRMCQRATFMTGF